MKGSGFRVQSLGLKVQALGFRVQGSGFMVQGVGCRELNRGVFVGFCDQGLAVQQPASCFMVQDWAFSLGRQM